MLGIWISGLEVESTCYTTLTDPSSGPQNPRKRSYAVAQESVTLVSVGNGRQRQENPEPRVHLD